MKGFFGLLKMVWAYHVKFLHNTFFFWVLNFFITLILKLTPRSWPSDQDPKLRSLLHPKIYNLKPYHVLSIFLGPIHIELYSNYLEPPQEVDEIGSPQLDNMRGSWLEVWVIKTRGLCELLFLASRLGWTNGWIGLNEILGLILMDGCWLDNN